MMMKISKWRTSVTFDIKQEQQMENADNPLDEDDEDQQFNISMQSDELEKQMLGKDSAVENDKRQR